MAAAYQIFGRQVQPHVLSLLTLGSVAAIAMWPRGGKAATDAAVVPSPVAAKPSGKEDDFDVEKIINDFIKEEK